MATASRMKIVSTMCCSGTDIESIRNRIPMGWTKWHAFVIGWIARVWGDYTYTCRSIDHRDLNLFFASFPFDLHNNNFSSQIEALRRRMSQ